MLEIRNHNGIELSTIGIGTWAIGGPYWTLDEPTGWGGPLDDNDSLTGLKAAMDAGITHIDTADVYGYGKSERLVGRAIKHTTHGLTIASKVGFAGTTCPSVYSPENIRFQCEQSLRNLKVGAIDIYYVHHCDFGPGDEFLPRAIEELNMLKEEGKIRSVGLSGYSSDDLIRIATKLRPDFIQSWATIEHDEFIRDDGALASFMQSNNIKFVAMMPFGQGRLLGKYSPDKLPQFESGDNRIGNPEFEEDSLRALAPRMDAMKKRFGDRPKDLIVPALGFILKHPVVQSVIPGFRSSEQVRDLLAAITEDYSDADHEFVLETFPRSEMAVHPWAD